MIGLAFISLGMSLQFADILTQPVLIIAGTLSLILIKFAITLGLARYYQHSWRNSTLLAASVAQSGEFAFLALIIALSQQIITPTLLSPLMWMASLSMLLTPAFYWLLHNQILPRLDQQNHLAATLTLKASTKYCTNFINRFWPFWPDHYPYFAATATKIQCHGQQYRSN